MRTKLEIGVFRLTGLWVPPDGAAGRAGARVAGDAIDGGDARTARHADAFHERYVAAGVGVDQPAAALRHRLPRQPRHAAHPQRRAGLPRAHPPSDLHLHQRKGEPQRLNILSDMVE